MGPGVLTPCSNTTMDEAASSITNSKREPREQFPVRGREPRKHIQFLSPNVSCHMSSLSLLCVCAHVCVGALSSLACVQATRRCGLLAEFLTKPEVCGAMAGFYVGSGGYKLGSSDLHSKGFTHWATSPRSFLSFPVGNIMGSLLICKGIIGRGVRPVALPR